MNLIILALYSTRVRHADGGLDTLWGGGRGWREGGGEGKAEEKREDEGEGGGTKKGEVGVRRQRRRRVERG